MQGQQLKGAPEPLGPEEWSDYPAVHMPSYDLRPKKQRRSPPLGEIWDAENRYTLRGKAK